MKRIMLLAFLLGVSVQGAYAASSADRAYIMMKQDNDIFLGEGQADLKDFQDKLSEALAAAKERARADLATNIRVSVHAETTEKTELKDGKVTEEVKSQSKSQADITLENIKYIEFKDFPAKGQVTVLASLDKTDYRRQLAGKSVKLYTAEDGMRLNGGLGGQWGWTKDSGGDPGMNIGIDFYWRGYILGIMQSNATTASGGPFLPSSLAKWSVREWTLSAGIDWTPWHTKLQPYIPLRLAYQFAGADPYIAHLFGAISGLGLRYWPTDSFAFDACARVNVPFNTTTLTTPDGTAFVDAQTGKPMAINISDVGFNIGLLWSGF